MKIIFLEAVQAHGGARKSTIELAKRLHQIGHESMIVDFWGSCHDFIEDVQQAQVPIQILVKRERPIAIFVSKNPLTIIKNMLDFILDWFKLKREFDKVAKKFCADLIIVNNIKTNSILKKGANYKIAYFARGWFDYRSLGRLTKIIFKFNSDYFIGVSQSTRQAIYTGGFATLDKIFVVPNAIDLAVVDQYKLRKRNSTKFTILHCGGFLPTKGQNLSLALAKKLKESAIDFKMIIMGGVYDSPASSDFLENIKAQIIMDNLGDDIEIITNSKNPYEIFKDSDLLIHPSDTEGLPRVVMEAMAFGIPVVANPVGGVTDYILNNYTGFITNYNNVEEYATCVIQLYNDKVLYSYISSNARKLIESNYQSKNQLDEFGKVFKGIDSNA